MAMATSGQIQAAVTAASQVVAGVGREQLDLPTPCDKYDVRTLANHMTGFLLMTELAAAKQPLPADADPAHDFTGGDWQALYAEHAPQVAQAWSDPAAWEGTTQFGPGECPAEFAGAITLMELVVHGWDLARATGQPIEVTDDVAEAVRAVVDKIGPGARENGSFAEPIDPAGSATGLDLALAASGRDPGWKP